MKIITFPYIGIEYTKIIKRNLESLGLNVQLPPKTTKKTYNLGVRHSSEMFCFPYKVTLGNFLEALDEGANILLMWDSLGQCKEKHYHKMQRFTLENLGYKDFELHGINRKNCLKVLKHLSGKSYFQIVKVIYNLIQDIKSYDDKRIWSNDKPNIGMIGEIYSVNDEIINYGFEEKVRRYGANPYNTVTLSSFLSHNLFGLNKNKFKKQAESYFNGKAGGHIVENVASLLDLIDRKVNGITHILPLSCSPEILGECVINKICQDNKIPLLRIPVDENNSEANLSTRLETFIELIKVKNEK